MSDWKDLIPILLILLLLTACGAEQEKAPASDQAHSKAESATQTADRNGSETASSDDEGGDVGDDTPLEWPSELMGDIPAASGGTITSIDRGDSFYGEGGPEYITVVSLREMDLPDCQAYIANLQALGYLYDVTEQETDTELTYSASLETGEAGVTFRYDFEYDLGFIAYNPQLNTGASGPDSDY